MAGHTVGKLTKPIWNKILYSAYDRVTRMLSRPAPARIEPSAPVQQEPLPTSPISASIPPITVNTRIPIDNEQLQRFNLLHSKGYKICFYGGGDWTIEVTPIIAVALMFFGAIIEIKKGNDKIWASSGQPLSLNWCIYYLKLIGFDTYIPNNKELLLSSKAAASYVNQGKEIEFKHPVRSKFFLTKPEPGNTHLSFQDFITGLKGCGFRFSSERAENLDGNSGIEAIIQHLNSNGIIGLIKGTRRIWLSGNIQGLGISRFIPSNFITSVTATATPYPIPAPISIAPVSASMPRNNSSTESADREPLLTLVTEFSIFRLSLSHAEKEYDFEEASDDEEMSTSSESEGEEELPLLVADKMLTEVILPQDNNQSTSGSEFYHHHVDLDGLQKAIATYSSSKPKVKSGIFSGQMSRELRDITASMQAIEKGDLKGIHQFIQLAKKLGHHNPILEEAIKVRRQISQLNSKENNFKRCLQK